ncbi:MAG: glutathione S-transferase family protein [Hyphomicrobiales bacterium]|nr:glutathione S-transferase family protein [Hyphomicrobiales bacterium]
MEHLTLYGRQGWGSVLAETQLVWYGMPYELRSVGDLFADEEAQRELEKINPAVQVPTLVLPDGGVMTESGAITLWLAEEAESSELVPEPGAAERTQFLRWLFFVTSNIYPVYTYADDPSRFVPQESAQPAFAERMGDRAKKLYGVLNDEAAAPWFLGDRFSALDIYICAMTHWRPGRPWFEENTPNLVAIAAAAKALPKLAEVWARNYPDD